MRSRGRKTATDRLLVSVSGIGHGGVSQTDRVHPAQFPVRQDPQVGVVRVIREVYKRFVAFLLEVRLH